MYHFLHRDNKLNMSVFFRSWDFFGGAKTYDFALSSFILQSFCSWLNMKPGKLGIYANSLHYYNRDRSKLENLVAESQINSDKLILDGNLGISESYDALRKVKLAEEAAFNKNFDSARRIRDSLEVFLYRDMVNTWIRKNEIPN